jgi:hypothetical protein
MISSGRHAKSMVSKRGIFQDVGVREFQEVGS